MLFIALLLICAILFIYKFWYYNSDYWSKRGIVQVNGILNKFVSSNRSISEVYKDIYNDHPTEAYIGVNIGMQPALIIKDVKDIQAVTQGEFQNFHSRGIFINPKEILANNVLFTSDYRRWRLLRHKLTPVFTSMKLKNMFYLMEHCARDFVEFIGNNQSARENTFNALCTYTTASIGATIFGIDTQTRNTMNSPFLEMAKSIFDPSLYRTLKFAISNVSVKFVKLFNIKQFGEYEPFFINIVKKVLNNRRNDKENRHDFIDMCLELQRLGTMQDTATNFEIEPTDEVLAAQAFFFFLAGVDTSATTMHFTLLELSSNPDILKRLHKEIDKVLDDCNEKLTYEDIDKLEYLDMVLNEAVRKYPPIGAIQRQCTNSTTLPVGQVKVEKNDIIILPVFALHRDEKYFPDPQKFDPERFSLENISKIVKFSYLPFGEGNRICLGARFARLQMKAALALLLRRYTLKVQKYEPRRFEPSFIGIRDTKANFELISRNEI